LNLIGEVVHHRIFGKGTVKEIKNGHIIVQFGNEEKKFAYPDSFQQFLVLENSTLKEQIDAEINKKLEAIKIEDAKQYKSNLIIKEPRTHTRETATKQAKKKQPPKSNIAFKCNYCDGGEDHDIIGFNGVCSDTMIKYNIEIEGRTWCRDRNCPCFQYWNGDITRIELEEIFDEGGFVCYESQMLRDWRAFAGVIQQGENRGRPMKLQKVQSNTLAILTTRKPYTEEEDRFIFAVFLVDDSYQGDNKEEGYVTTNSEYKIKLSNSEAVNLKFWDFYFNPNSPGTLAWGHGLHRYITDQQSVQILEAIVSLKAGTPDENLANRFAEHFCMIKGLERKRLPKPYGALKR